MHRGAFATRMLPGFYKYYAKIAFLFFCSSVQKMKQKKELRYMKKTYVSPLMVEVNVEAESMLAASMKIDKDKTVDTSNGGQLGKENDRQWGNLWN